jgi:hypothetical protein
VRFARLRALDAERQTSARAAGRRAGFATRGVAPTLARGLHRTPFRGTQHVVPQ